MGIAPEDAEGARLAAKRLKVRKKEQNKRQRKAAVKKQFNLDVVESKEAVRANRLAHFDRR
jgi:hypothetical protein